MTISRRSFRRHHRHAPIVRAHRFRGPARNSATPRVYRHRPGNHQPALLSDDIALAQRRVVFNLDPAPDRTGPCRCRCTPRRSRCDSETRSAIPNRVFRSRSRHCRYCCHRPPGFAGRAKTIAGCRPALIVRCRDREIASVAGAHAIGLRAAGITDARALAAAFPDRRDRRFRSRMAAGS